MNYLIIEVKRPLRSIGGNAILGRGQHKVCWTDGPRFTVWGKPRVLFHTVDVEVVDYDTESMEKAKLMQANICQRQEAAVQEHMACIARHLQTAPISVVKEQPKKLTGAQLVEMTSKDYTTIEVVFEEGGKHYTYKAFCHAGVTVGDFVVVKVPDGTLKVVHVVGVHDKPNLRSGINYKWIVDRVRVESYQATVELEEQLDAEIEVARRKAQERSVLDKLLQHSEEGSILRELLAKHVG